MVQVTTISDSEDIPLIKKSGINKPPVASYDVSTSFFYTLGLSALVAIMEYLVLERFFHPNPFSLDFTNPYCLRILKRTALVALVLFPISLITFWFKRRFPTILMNSLCFVAATITSTKMISISQFNPTFQQYEMMPGLSALWILLCLQMESFFPLLNLIITMGYFFKTTRA